MPADGAGEEGEEGEGEGGGDVAGVRAEGCEGGADVGEADGAEEEEKQGQAEG